MASEWLGVPLAQVRVFQGDTDKLLFGRGTFAQRSMSAGGSALKRAADEVVRKGKRIAGWMLECSEPHIVSDNVPVATKTNLLGVRGGSEAGNVGAPSAIVNAIIDALSPWGVTDIPMPATPQRSASGALSTPPLRRIPADSRP